MLRSLLNASTLASWITESFPIIQTVVLVLVAIFAVVIIVCVLLQTSNPDGGSNAITGTNDSYYAVNKGSSKEGRLKKAVIISAIAIFVLAVIYFIAMGIYNPN